MMTDQRLEQTIQRIERALARIAAVADAAASGEAGGTDELATRHEAMRKQVRAQLEKLDNVIGELDR